MASAGTYPANDGNDVKDDKDDFDDDRECGGGDNEKELQLGKSFESFRFCETSKHLRQRLRGNVHHQCPILASQWIAPLKHQVLKKL